MYWSKSLKNKLQYVYFDNFVKFVNCVHHKPPRTASIFLTRHLGLLTRHHGRCHATSVISMIYFGKTIEENITIMVIYRRKYVHLFTRNMHMCYQSL